MKISALAVLLPALVLQPWGFAETRTMTLRQALDLALSQSPDLVLARLDQQKARQQVIINHDPFVPKVFAGSGAAWTYGYPSSIDGNAPSIVQARTVMALFNRPQSYLVAQAGEGVRSAGIALAAKQQDVVYRVSTLFLDAEQAGHSLDAIKRQAESLTRVRQLIEQRVAEGRVLPIEAKRANLDVLRANQRAEVLTVDSLNAESALALALGMGGEDRVHPAMEERQPLAIPGSEDAIQQALQASNELKSLESNVQSKMLELKSYRAERLPKVDLVAQYALFAKYNYQQYFTKFQNNNLELGASVSIPLLVGRASQAYAAQAQLDIEKLRVQVSQTRSRISADLQKAYQDLKRTEAGRDLARADLDLAREEVTLDLAQMDEGRLPLSQVEAARAAEDDKWLALYDAQHAAELARLNLLRQMGTLQAALK